MTEAHERDLALEAQRGHRPALLALWAFREQPVLDLARACVARRGFGTLDMSGTAYFAFVSAVGSYQPRAPQPPHLFQPFWTHASSRIWSRVGDALDAFRRDELRFGPPDDGTTFDDAQATESDEHSERDARLGRSPQLPPDDDADAQALLLALLATLPSAEHRNKWLTLQALRDEAYTIQRVSDALALTAAGVPGTGPRLPEVWRYCAARNHALWHALRPIPPPPPAWPACATLFCGPRDDHSTPSPPPPAFHRVRQRDTRPAELASWYGRVKRFYTRTRTFLRLTVD